MCHSVEQLRRWWEEAIAVPVVNSMLVPRRTTGIANVQLCKVVSPGYRQDDVIGSR